MTQEKDKREQLEAAKVNARTVELTLAPIRGQFDIAHLKAINHHLFQDLPKHGFTDVTPGEFRETTQEHKDWKKQRNLESINASSIVAYSSMDDKAIAQLEKALESASPEKLKKLRTKEFSEALGQLYVACDYVHPFPDGNSRTLRVFTKQLAKESGYELDWSRFNEGPNGRDKLYIARDLSVNEIAINTVKNDDTKREIVFTLDTFDGNKRLPELLHDAIRPERSIAFEQMTEKDARKKHPELSSAYSYLHKAEEQLSTKNPNIREKQLALFRDKIIENLNKGETNNFQMNPVTKDKTINTEVEQQKDKGTEIERKW